MSTEPMRKAGSTFESPGDRATRLVDEAKKAASDAVGDYARKLEAAQEAAAAVATLPNVSPGVKDLARRHGDDLSAKRVALRNMPGGQ